MKTLILSQCLIRTEEQGRLLGVSMRLAEILNPDCWFMLMDNNSPLNPMQFLDWHIEHDCTAGLVVATRNANKLVYRFPDQIGHFSPKFVHEMPNPKDGPGRAIMTGLQIARDSGYDRVCYIEGDSLFAKPVEWGFQRMTKPVACCPRTKWGYLENNVTWFADLAWLFDVCRFPQRYDWPNQTMATNGPGNEGERQWEALLSPYLETLPVKGGRGEGFTTAHNLRALYPEGLDLLTHVDAECYREFLRMNNHDDLVEKL